MLYLLQCVLSVRRITNPSNIPLSIVPKKFGQTLSSGFALVISINNVNNKEIILGMPSCEDGLIVNHVLLIAKQYLYFCRCRKKFPIFKVFTSRLRKIQNLELVVAKSKIRLSPYTAKWGKLDL